MSVTETIDTALLRKGMSVAEAADAAGVGVNTVRRLRNGDDTVQRHIVGKVANALGVDAVALWNELVASTERSAA